MKLRNVTAEAIRRNSGIQSEGSADSEADREIAREVVALDAESKSSDAAAETPNVDDTAALDAASQHTEPVAASPLFEQWVQEMTSVPGSHIYGAGSTQENRCTEAEINAVVEATVTTFGIAKKTALTILCEMIRRGGANTGTPESFSVDIKCPDQNVIATVSKRDIIPLVRRLANGKTMRNLAEGMADVIVRYGLAYIEKNPGHDRPGDLAKKVDNRLSFEKKPPLTPKERVGCASYAQWLPHLDTLVGSTRLKGLLAQDLMQRKRGRAPSQEGGSKNPSAKTPSKGGQAGQAKKGKNKSKDS